MFGRKNDQDVGESNYELISRPYLLGGSTGLGDPHQFPQSGPSKTAAERRPDAATATTLPWPQRVGSLGIAILCGDLICAAAALGFLYFLWLGDATNHVWQSIVLAGWVTRSIAVASLLIRTATATQTAISTSMIAAVLLQRGVVLLSRFPSVSLQRLHPSGPFGLTWTVLIKQHLWTQIDLSLGLVILSLTTLFFQFTSTVLLSAVQLDAVTGLNTSMNLAYGIDSDSLIDTDTFRELFWSKRPTAFPSWAEYSEPAISIDGIYDTGTSLRALLPVKDTAQREVLKAFDGVATLVDSRVVCVRPQLQDLFFRASDQSPVVFGRVGTDFTAPGFGLWCDADCRQQVSDYQTTFGDVLDSPNWDPDWGYPGSQILYIPDSAQQLLPFQCSVALGTTQELPVSICSVPSWTGLLSPMWPTSRLHYNGTSYGEFLKFTIDRWFRLGLTQAYLVIETSGAWEIAGEENGYGNLQLESPVLHQEWVTYPGHNSNFNVSISFSLCFSNFDTIDVPLKAQRRRGHNETVVNWNPDTDSYNTTDLLIQLGVNPNGSLQSQRSIFQLQKPTLPGKLRVAATQDQNLKFDTPSWPSLLQI